MKTRSITQAAVIAACYTALNLLAAAVPALGTLAFGPLQVRLAEGLTVLPFLFPAAVPGLALGCLVSNLLGAAFGLGGGPLDVLFGTLATLLAALLTARCRRAALAPLPPVLLNGLVVSGALALTLKLPYLPTAAAVTLGEALACYGLGYPLLRYLVKRPDLLEKLK